MKKLFTLLTLALFAVSGAWAQTTLFLWQYDGTSTYGDGSNNGEFAMTATTGTAKFVTYEKKKTSAEGTISYDESVTDNDLKPNITNGCKLGNNGAHIKCAPASGTFKTGDIIYVCAYNPVILSTGAATPASTADINATGVLASSLATGLTKSAYKIGSFTLTSDADVIYVSRASSSVGIAAIKIVRPAPSTDPVISAADASIVATESGVEVTQDIAVTGANLTGSTLTATLSPAVSGLSVTLASNTITDGAISTTATIHYTQTANAKGSTTLTLSDGTTSKDVTITYKAKVVAATLKTISEEITWDWTKLKAITTSALYNSSDKAIKLSGETVPSMNDDIVYTDYEDSEMTIDAAFDAEAISFKGQYPIRNDKFCQNGTVHFKTSVPGSIVVKFSDTGSSASSTAVKRYLQVNGEQTEYWTSREKTGEGAYSAQLNVTSGAIEVPAGDVTINGKKGRL